MFDGSLNPQAQAAVMRLFEVIFAVKKVPARFNWEDNLSML